MTSVSKSSGTIQPFFFQKILILVAGFWVFLPSFHGDWLWDDNVLITGNPLMNDPDGFWKIWTQPGIMADYYPLTATVERIQWKLWGMETVGYHLTNFVLHMASAFLVWRLLAKLGLKLAWLGALFFAIHPVQVESVAWIAELKNVLSMTAFLCAMCAWIDYDRMGKRRDYFLALGLFLVALLCKLTVVMFPLVILLYAWWRRGRISALDLKVSAPFFLISLSVGSITFLFGTWVKVFSHLGPQFMPAGGALGRVVLVGQEIAFYFSKSVVPVGLLPVYPKWAVDISSPVQYLPWICVIGTLYWLWICRRTWGRHALLGVGFFLINLLPCPGFIPGPNMGYAWVMDHFLYLPIIGLIGLAVAGFEQFLEKTAHRAARACAIGVVTVVAALMAVGSHAYAGLYDDPFALWTYAKSHNPDSWMIHLNLGETYQQRAQFPAAIDELQAADKLFPDYPVIHYELGDAFSQSGQLAEAIAQYQIIEKTRPNFHDVTIRLSRALSEAHRIPEATALLEEQLQRDPGNASAHLAMGDLLLQDGKTTEAEDQYKQAAAIDPANGQSHGGLGNVLLKANRLPEALAEFQKAAQINPRDIDVIGNIGVILVRMGRIPEAAEQFQTALQIDPNSAEAHLNMGSFLLVIGKIPDAVQEYQEALRLKPNLAQAQQDLARAQAMEKAHSAPAGSP